MAPAHLRRVERNQHITASQPRLESGVEAGGAAGGGQGGDGEASVDARCPPWHGQGERAGACDQVSRRRSPAGGPVVESWVCTGVQGSCCPSTNVAEHPLWAALLCAGCGDKAATGWGHGSWS